MIFRSKVRFVAVLIPAGAVFALGAWAGPHLHQVSLPASQPQPAVAPVADFAAPSIPGVGAPNYRAIVTRYGAAVVNINTEGKVQVSDSNSDDEDNVGPGVQGQFDNPPENDPFFKFFRNLPMPHGRTPMRGLGSGFIISPDGLILTNAHVVRDADSVTVKLSDRREFKAKVLGVDSATDIAVLKIKAKDLPTVQLGDSDQLGVGDYVLAIGAPYGFEESATSGIVSAKGRSLPGDSYVPFIQTDVAVNPGNSGGPLFDAAGQVVGINSQIYSNTGGYEGLSFAIPIKVALQVKDQIVANGKVVHARLGVTVQPLTQALARSFHLDKPDGALVASVVPESAAARAGIKPGDVILKYNDRELQDAADLSAQVGMARPGEKIQLQVWRDKALIYPEIKLGEAEQIASNDESGATRAHGRLGLAVRSLTPGERKEQSINGGLMVQEVSGPAESAGIQPGDIILSVNGTTVSSAEQLRDIVAKQDQQVALLIARGDTRIFVPVPLA